jgi:hypothetical protein
LEQVFEIDRILTEQHLGLKWQPIEVDTVEDLQYEEQETRPDASEQTIPGTNIKVETVRGVLEMIAKKSNFLLEDNIAEFIKNYPEEDQMLVVLDNVFQILKIENVDDIAAVQNYFEEEQRRAGEGRSKKMD